MCFESFILNNSEKKRIEKCECFQRSPDGKKEYSMCGFHAWIQPTYLIYYIHPVISRNSKKSFYSLFIGLYFASINFFICFNFQLSSFSQHEAMMRERSSPCLFMLVKCVCVSVWLAQKKLLVI